MHVRRATSSRTCGKEAGAEGVAEGVDVDDGDRPNYLDRFVFGGMICVGKAPLCVPAFGGSFRPIVLVVRGPSVSGPAESASRHGSASAMLGLGGKERQA